MNDYYIIKKKVDKSTFYQGFTVPVMFHELCYEKIGHRLHRGETLAIKAVIDNIPYDVNLINQAFDEKKYPNHSDILQIRYDGNAAFKAALREKFNKTWRSLQDYHAANRSYKGFEAEKGCEEYVVVYATPVKGSVWFDCITQGDYAGESAQLSEMDEFAFENATDENASVTVSLGLRKIRHLSHAIGNSLKVLYGYRCQICGAFIGEKYGATVIHAHHIDYFTRSLNNNADNIMIVCPNHHSIIHDRNPRFHPAAKVYEYPNGYVEGLLLNKHI